LTIQKKLDNLIKNTYREHRKIKKMNKIKGTITPDDVIIDILNRLNNINYQAFIIVFDKQNLHKFIKTIENKYLKIICKD